MFEKGRIIAHRGCHDNINIYENTLEAFKKAVNKKYIIELDVHITKDDKIIVFHDHNTKRILKKDMSIEKSNYDELNNQDVIHIPLLTEVLELVNGKVPLLIELKQESKIGRLERGVMNILKNYKGKYYIQSFNPLTLVWFRKNYPNIIRGQLFCKKNKKSFISNFILTKLIINPITKPNFISLRYTDIKDGKLKKYKKKNIPLLAWTISNKDIYNKYKDKYDNLICEKII